jgi:hypothetical protein
MTTKPSAECADDGACLANARQSGVESTDADVVEQFALAVAKEGTDALLIGPDNKSIGRTSIHQAAKRCLCFAVELADDIIGVDADTPKAAHYIRNVLVDELESRAIRLVIQNSGTPGHLHLFAVIADNQLKAQVESAARLHGCRAGQPLRPPLSPHRRWLRVSLVTPETPAEALKALAPRPPAPGGKRKTTFSARIFRQLRSGDPEGAYRSRSEMIQGFALAAVNARLPEAWLVKVLLDPHNRGGEKIQQLARKQGEREAQRYVAMVYRKAQSYAATHPSFGGRPEVIAEIERRVDSACERWTGRSGATDRAILEAHLNIARRCGSLEHGASVREVAVLAGINSISTVSSAHGRLERDQYLRRVEKANHGAAARYVVGLPKSRSRTIVPMGALGDCSGRELGADVFRWGGGLGKSAARVYSALLIGGTTEELAGRLGSTVSAVRKQLRRLATVGLGARDMLGHWGRTPADLDDVARHLGVAGEGDRQRARYQYERELYRLRGESRSHSGRLVTIRDTTEFGKL